MHSVAGRVRQLFGTEYPRILVDVNNPDSTCARLVHSALVLCGVSPVGTSEFAFG